MEKYFGPVTFPDLLIWLPLIFGLVTFILRKEQHVKAWSLFGSILILMVSSLSLIYSNNKVLNNESSANPVDDKAREVMFGKTQFQKR